jgi:predicted RNA-binding Zn ribbon-like protein
MSDQYDTYEDWGPDKVAEKALEELGGWEASLDGLETRLKQLIDMVDRARETVRDHMVEVEAARDGFCDYYDRLAAVSARDEGAVMPDGPPPDPDDISVSVDSDVEELVATLDEMLDSLANVRTCGNPKCGRAFLASRYTREKRYCSVYCRVQAHRARQKSDAAGAERP